MTKEQASRILDVIDEILGDHGITVVTEDDRDEYERFYVDELTVDAPAEALPDKDVDIVLTHEEAQRIADQLFPWL